MFCTATSENLEEALQDFVEIFGKLMLHISRPLNRQSGRLEFHDHYFRLT